MLLVKSIDVLGSASTYVEYSDWPFREARCKGAWKFGERSEETVVEDFLMTSG